MAWLLDHNRYQQALSTAVSVTRTQKSPDLRGFFEAE